MLLAVEMKACERDKGRLRFGEIAKDINKLAAHREEVEHRGGAMAPIMLVVDLTTEPGERMVQSELERAMQLADGSGVRFFYLSPVRVSASPR